MATTRRVFYLDSQLDMHYYAVNLMWAHESMTRCETVLYVDDVQ